MAALVDYALYERIRPLLAACAALTGKLGQVYADVPAETAEAGIEGAASRRRPDVATSGYPKLIFASRLERESALPIASSSVILPSRYSW